MRRYFIALFIVCLVSQPGFSQGLRRCGCKTWRAWNTSTPKEENEGSWKRKQNYEKYKHECIIACRQELERRQKNAGAAR